MTDVALEILFILLLILANSEAIGLGLVVLGIAYLSLVIGELVPKHLGLSDAERIASAVASPMRALSVVGFFAQPPEKVYFRG